MAKKSEKSEQKANLYLLAIVAIVAVVGVVVLVLNSGGLTSVTSSDLSGQAVVSGAMCPKANTQGCAGTWVYVKSEEICTCIISTQVKGTGTTESAEERCPRLCCSNDSPCSRWSDCYGGC